MNKTVIISVAFASAMITAQTAFANNFADHPRYVEPKKTETAVTASQGFSAANGSTIGRASEQNFSSDPSYSPLFVYESNIDGSAGGGEAGNDSGGPDSSDTGDGGDTGTAGPVD